MSDEQSLMREESLIRAFAGASRVECGPVDAEAARLAYRKAGFDVTDELVEFLGTYGGRRSSGRRTSPGTRRR
ncbi:hypothetical protein ACWCQM_34440 [Streptomyces sp. NPDC002125]